VSAAKDHPVIQATVASTSVSFIPKAIEAEQQTLDQGWICLTPRHLACPLFVARWLFCTCSVEQVDNRDGKEIVKETDG
jgi:hypothetical protein